MGCPDCILGHKDYYLKFYGVVIPAPLLQNNMADFAKLGGTDFFIKKKNKPQEMYEIPRHLVKISN